MNKLFWKNTNFRKCRNRIAGVLMSIAMVVGICMPVQAASASASGTINGVPCYATLTVDDKVTATTVSSLMAYYYVSLTCTFYYTDENGRVQMDTDSLQNSSTHSLSITAYPPLEITFRVYQLQAIILLHMVPIRGMLS